METISERVAHVREISELSAAELGRRAGLSRATIAAIEADPDRVPETATLLAFSSCTGVAFEWLLSGKGEEPSAESVKAAVSAAGKAA